jgi:hypothetical protein
MQVDAQRPRSRAQPRPRHPAMTTSGENLRDVLQLSASSERHQRRGAGHAIGGRPSEREPPLTKASHARDGRSWDFSRHTVASPGVHQQLETGLVHGREIEAIGRQRRAEGGADVLERSLQVRIRESPRVPIPRELLDAGAERDPLGRLGDVLSWVPVHCKSSSDGTKPCSRESAAGASTGTVRGE